jgi:hypothetical protein
MPASRHQDHTISPHASGAFVKAALRVHRNPPRVRDDRESPLLVGRDANHVTLICSSEKQKYFCERGWTRHDCGGEVICPSCCFVAPDNPTLSLH